MNYALNCNNGYKFYNVNKKQFKTVFLFTKVYCNVIYKIIYICYNVYRIGCVCLYNKKYVLLKYILYNNMRFLLKIIDTFGKNGILIFN